MAVQMAPNDPGEGDSGRVALGVHAEHGGGMFGDGRPVDNLMGGYGAQHGNYGELKSFGAMEERLLDVSAQNSAQTEVLNTRATETEVHKVVQQTSHANRAPSGTSPGGMGGPSGFG
jgi:hypothetical protein